MHGKELNYKPVIFFAFSFLFLASSHHFHVTCTAGTVRQPAISASLVCGRDESRIQVSRLGRSGVMFSSPTNSWKNVYNSFFLLSFFLCTVGCLQRNAYAGPQGVHQTGVALVALSGTCARPAFPYPIHGPPSTTRVSAQNTCTERCPFPYNFIGDVGALSFKTWHRT